MALLPPQPEQSLTTATMNDAISLRVIHRQPAGVDAATVGGPCERAAWYDFRHTTAQSPEPSRAMQKGGLISVLRAIGVDVHDRDEDGQPFIVSALAGHLHGQFDGACLNVPEAPKAWHVLLLHPLEAFDFISLPKRGVEAAMPEQYARAMLLMSMTGMRRTLYVAYNLADGEVYAERIRYDANTAKRFMARAENIINAAYAPERVGKPDHWACANCRHAPLCQGVQVVVPQAGVPLTISCRNCLHSTPQKDTEHGRWTCDHQQHQCTLARENQDLACPDHLLIPDLITFAEHADAGTESDGSYFVEYRNADGTTWRQGRHPDHYSSFELTQLPAPLVGAGAVEAVKQAFSDMGDGARVVAVDPQEGNE